MERTTAIKVSEVAKGDVIRVGRGDKIETLKVLNDPRAVAAVVTLQVVSFSLSEGRAESGTDKVLDLPAKQVVLNVVGGELTKPPKKATKKTAAKKTATKKAAKKATKKKAAKKKAKKKTSRR